MIPDVSRAFSWLDAHPDILQGIRRGIERETLRITTDGHLAITSHPESLGAALTHPWITTDFAEALLEFITPVAVDVDESLAFLRDLHRHTARKLGEELMWPLSMPCFIDSAQEIELAKYGSSNIGRFKMLYREGLKNRYGALMQTISGVHYNFSLPIKFWQAWAGITDEQNSQDIISAGYFRLIRNYYRFGWIIPYLFGASPAICSSFLRNKKTTISFKHTEKGICYLPYATSLRLSDLGYTNKSQSNLTITFNELNTYIDDVRRAIHTPSQEYAKLGLKRNDRYIQLNTNVLQIENELYMPIRPKRITKIGESPSDALQRAGIEYIEVRSLDINPFSPTGIDATQVCFLDLFLIWCALADAPQMNHDELLSARKNWNTVILAGRKPGQTVNIGSGSHEPLITVGKALLNDLRKLAVILDRENKRYQQVCDQLLAFFDDPGLTFSARILQEIQDEGFTFTGMKLAKRYRHMLQKEPLELLTEEQFSLNQALSWKKQHDIEANDTLSFEQYLRIHAAH